ncbi:unnamed protein product, partial [Owenia fusiformis]
MQEKAWDDNIEMQAQGQQEMAARQPSTRSQDDATVGYYFQRPHNDQVPNYQNKRWAAGDDSALPQAGRAMTVTELETGLHALSIDRDYSGNNMNNKKIWEDEQKAGGDAKPYFGTPWTPRDDTWGVPSEHAVSHPINMQRNRSFPGNDMSNVLNPRSSEPGQLHMNMVEYVLGGSPTGKELDSRLGRRQQGYPPQQGEQKGEKNSKTPSPFEGQKEGSDPEMRQDHNQANGIVQNGMEDQEGQFRNPGSRQTSPTEDQQPMAIQSQLNANAQKFIAPKNEMIEGGNNQMPPQMMPQQGLHLDAQQFEPVGI